NGLHVLPAPLDPGRCRAALTVAAPVIREAANAADVTVIVDLGRVDPDPVTLALMRAADALIIVTSPDAHGLAHLAARAPDVRGWSSRPGL
ncbi:hypothetical protein ACR9EG_13020, partial [Lactococcus lactis]|uniref:hypothetical protein n=2 Tax=Bacillati TaxID=1783272 RepID=UPI003EC0A888